MMSTYSYRCDDCKTQFCIKASIQEKETGKSDKFKCPQCHSAKIKSVFSIGNALKNIFRSDDKPCCSDKDGGCCG